MNQDRVLVVEDDDDLSFIYRVQLEQNGFSVDLANDYHSTEKCITQNEYDIVLLDMMLSDTNGLELCNKIRTRTDCPIIFISCIGDRQTMVHALALGGDDYMVKPIDYDEMIARIRANLRRTKKKEKEAETVQCFRQFVLDRAQHCVWHAEDDGERKDKINLSPIEYKLLVLFVDRADSLILYEEMYRCIWECDDLGDVRTVMVHVSNLRKKLDWKHRDLIHTVRGAGYIFSDI